MGRTTVAPKPSAQRSGSSTVAPATTPGQAAIRAREGGATAGVTVQRGQSVFASSAAPKASASKPATAKSGAPATTGSTRSATGDLWSGVTIAGTPAIASAAAADVQGGGLGTAAVAGLAILGLGLTGLAGGFLVTAARRRRAGASNR